MSRHHGFPLLSDDHASGRSDALARLGLSAIEGIPIPLLLDEAVDILHAEIEEVSFVSILELLPHGDAFVIRGGTDWLREATGTEIPLEDTLAGANLRADAPLLVDDLEDDNRFETPRILIDHGARSACSVLIYGLVGPVGAMGVFRRDLRPFTTRDVSFLQTVANTIGLAMERSELEQRLVRSRKLEAMARFAGGVAHQFNNVLTPVLGHAQILRESLDENAPERESVVAIGDAGQRARELVERLLAFAQGTDLHPVPVDVSREIASMSSSIEDLLPDSITLETDLASDLPEVELDRDRLEHALLHLVRNACQAMDDGGTVTIETREVDLVPQEATRLDLRTGRYVRLSVRDTGQGMDASTAERAFEPFFTTRDVGEGVGLGLSEVRGFATSSGGRVHLESHVGRGTRVLLHFPR